MKPPVGRGVVPGKMMSGLGAVSVVSSCADQREGGQGAMTRVVPPALTVELPAAK